VRHAIASRRSVVSSFALSGIVVLAALCRADVARSQESNLVAAPMPKAEALEKVHPSAGDRMRLDRDAIALGFLQGGAELFDGVTTRYFVHHCATCFEADPVSKFLLGPRPTWKGMIVFGSIEAIATTYVYQGLRRSSNRWLRRLAPGLPLVISGVHIRQGASNLKLKPLS
jgi:hypothetical protein